MIFFRFSLLTLLSIAYYAKIKVKIKLTLRIILSRLSQTPFLQRCSIENLPGVLYCQTY